MLGAVLVLVHCAGCRAACIAMSLRMLSGLAGVHAGALFGTAPPHVDPAKRPGASSLAPLVGLPGTVMDTLTLRTLVWSPNLVWLAVAAATYAALPYDMQAAARGFSWTWVAPRVAINASVAFAYYFYFYYGLFVAKWAKRKFAPGSYPTAENMLHNAVHWTGGVLMASLLECVMVRLWATGKVPHVPDSELASSPAEALKLLAWVAVVPVWRELHFYAAHRFVHIRALYTFVHSLHHRITDPEPFSGLTMHPVEHLYYFANAFIPTLYLRSSPFLYTWISVHAVLAPACGHSGWEDHFQSDLCVARERARARPGGCVGGATASRTRAPTSARPGTTGFTTPTSNATTGRSARRSSTAGSARSARRSGGPNTTQAWTRKASPSPRARHSGASGLPRLGWARPRRSRTDATTWSRRSCTGSRSRLRSHPSTPNARRSLQAPWPLDLSSPRSRSRGGARIACRGAGHSTRSALRSGSPSSPALRSPHCPSSTRCGSSRPRDGLSLGRRGSSCNIIQPHIVLRICNENVLGDPTRSLQRSMKSEMGAAHAQIPAEIQYT